MAITQVKMIQWIENRPDTQYPWYWEGMKVKALRRICRTLLLGVYNRISTKEECIDALMSFSYNIHHEK